MDRRPRRPVLAFVWMFLAVTVVAGCSSIAQPSPVPTPMDFPSMAGELANRGIVLSHITSGDDGCHNPTLTATAIGFDASGLGLTVPTRLRVYIFGSAASYERRRVDVDICVAAWVKDPASAEFVDAKPFVLAGQGPWPPAFRAAIQAALTVAAGNGG